MSDKRELAGIALRGALIATGLMCIMLGSWNTPTPYLGIGIIATQLFNAQVREIFSALRERKVDKLAAKAAKKAEKDAKREARRISKR